LWLYSAGVPHSAGLEEKMQMKIVSKMALAIALGGMALAAPTFAAKKEDKPAASAAKATPAVQKAAYDAQKAADAGDFPTALSNYATAKAAIVSDDDKMMVGQVGYHIYQKNKDRKLYMEAVTLMIDSGKAKADVLPQLYEIQGQLFAVENKDNASAAASFQKAYDAGAPIDEIVPLLVESYALSGQTSKALTALNAAIAKQNAAGKPIPTDWYQKGVQIGYRPKATPAEMPAINAQLIDLAQKWVASDPQAHNWNAALRVYEEKSNPDNDTRIDVMRLLRAAGALEGAYDYREYAEDVYLRFPNEAMQVLQEGAGKNVINLTAKGDAADIMGIVKGKVAADKASLPAADKSARAAANGKAALSTADAYVGYGDYAKAIDLYKVALAKGGVDANLVNIHLGWAQALSGDSAGAKTSFAAVTGSRKPLADFWIIHLDHPTIPNAPKAAG
jgi:hypothetical protein